MPLGASRLTLLAFQASVAAEAEVIRKKVGVTAFGNAQVDTSRSKFGGASALFDGTGDYIVTSNNTQVDIGTGAVTFECFFNVDNDTGSGSSAIMGNRESLGSGEIQMMYRNSDQKVQVNGRGTGSFDANAVGSALGFDTWHHFAWARNASGDWAVFVNGSRVANGTGYTQELAAKGISVGAFLNGGNAFNQTGNGWIDEVRVSNSDRYGVGNTSYTVPTAAFVNDDNTKLLLHMNGTDGSTFFEDNNGVRAQSSLVGLGGADVDTAQSKFGGASFYVDGTGGDGVLAYLPSNPTAITVEGWYKFDGVPSSKSCMFAHNRAATGYNARDWFVTYNYVLNDWSLNVKDDAGTTLTRINSTANSHENTNWHHLAVCMESGGYIRMFIDGTLQEEADISSNTMTDWTSSLNRIWLGHWYSSANNHECYYDEFRISDTIRYTTSFTAPTAPFTNDSNTIMLLHPDGPNGSQVFRDDNGKGRTPCNFDTIFGGELDTAQKKFGVSSWYQDAEYDGAKMADESILDSIGTGAFTIECFVRKDTDITGLQYIWHGNNQQSLRYDDTNNTLEYCADNGETTRITGGALSNNTWYHIAVSRSGTTTKLFIDGTQSGSDYTGDDRSFANNSEYLFGVSRSGSSSWRGHIDELRISNTARYTEDFTAPTEPFQNDLNTLLLLHLDGTDASTVIIDDNGTYTDTPRTAVSVTAYNNAQVDTAQSKFGGASLYLDGSDDYLEIAGSTFMNDFANGPEFTVEYWVRPQSTSGFETHFGNWGGSSTRSFFLGSNNGTTIAFYWTDTGNSIDTTVTTGSALTRNAWNHVALVGTATQFKLYTNGVLRDSGTREDIRDQAELTKIGASATLAEDFLGHIDELRVSKVARYTGSTYTEPTSAFVNDSDTVLLLHMDGADASTTFTDDNS